METSIDLDKIFVTLDDHSKKLKEFVARHEKDALQILSKLEVAMPEGYENIFTLLNTYEEHKKGADVQLTTAKFTIKAHCESSLAIEETSDGEGGSMMHTFVRSSHTAGGGSPKTKCHGDHCNKGSHTSCKDGNPLYYSLIAALNGGKGSGGGKSSPKSATSARKLSTRREVTLRKQRQWCNRC